jgi:hypothetical protein
MKDLFKELPSKKPLLCKLNFENYANYIQTSINKKVDEFVITDYFDDKFTYQQLIKKILDKKNILHTEKE